MPHFVAISLLWALLVFIGLPTASAQNEYTLQEALSAHLVDLSATGNGGYFTRGLKVKLTNKGRGVLKIRVKPGLQFSNAANFEQDLMVLKEELLVVAPAGTTTHNLQTACISPTKGSPATGRTFVFKGMAEDGLLELAEWIHLHAFWDDHAAQAAIWAVVQKSLLQTNSVHQEKLVALFALVAQITGIKPQQFGTAPKPVYSTSISSSMDALVPENTRVSLRVYDLENRLVKTQFANEPYEPGFHRIRFGFYHFDEDSTRKFRAQLETQSGAILAQKEIGPEDVIPEIKAIKKEVFLAYELTADADVRYGVYDAQDQLYWLVKDRQPLKAGFYKANLDETRELPDNKEYYFKVKVNGKTLAEQKYFLTAEEEKAYPTLVKRGLFKCQLADPLADAKLAVYDEAERVIWVVFEGSMSHGTKQVPFVFQHTQGPQAKFTLKLTDGEGALIATQAVSGK